MNIVIAGAGNVGHYLTELLASENHNITLVDLDESVLEYIDEYSDILSIRGDVTSMEVLKQAKVQNANLFIAVTTDESANLLASIIAKQLGAKKTIARVSKSEYLSDESKEYFKSIGVDHVVSPKYLAAQEIKRLVQRSTVTDIFDFEEGLISILGFTLDSDSVLIGKSLHELNRESLSLSMQTICILREGQTIIPDDDEILQGNDHIYLVTTNTDFNKINQYLGKTIHKIKNVMIIGGGPIAHLTSKILENEFNLTMVVRNEARCKRLLENLSKTLVINGDWNDLKLLKEEGLAKMDAFIALTANSETNIISSILAEQKGVNKTIALVDNFAYTDVSLGIGVDTLINEKAITANNIFRYVRKGKIEAIASLHGVEAEIIEFVIEKNNRVTRHSLADLHLPQKSRVIGVVRDEKGIIPSEDFILNQGDKAIVISLPGTIKKVENIFR